MKLHYDYSGSNHPPRLLRITVRYIALLPAVLLISTAGTTVAAPALSADSSATVRGITPALRSAGVDDSSTSFSTDTDLPGKSLSPANSRISGATAVLKKTTTVSRKTTPRDSIADSLARAVRRDSLLALESRRGDQYLPDRSPAAETSTHITEGDIFCADPVLWYDIPKVKRFTAGPKLGIVNSANRLLYYGNTAPVDRRYQGMRLLFRRASDPVTGDDALLSTEYGALAIPGDGSIHFIPRSAGLISPEIALAWETGVFDGNFLTVRFSRPVTRNLTVNIFSNYRFLKGMTFNHDAGNMYATYAALTPDTSLLSDHGYNPLVNEYYCGADAFWSSAGTRAFFRVKYGDLTDELPINRKPIGTYPEQLRSEHYPLTFEGGVGTAMHQRWFLNAEARYETDFHRRTYRVKPDSNGSKSTAFSSTDFSGGLMAGIHLPAGDSLSLHCILHRLELSDGDTIGTVMFDARPELVWSRPFNLLLLSGTASLRAGYFIHPWGDPRIDPLPLVSGGIRSKILGSELNIYAQRDVIDYLPIIDSTVITPAFYDAFYRFGAEANREWQLIGLLLGYQFCRGIDSVALGRAWLSGMAPYAQPRSTFIIAPRFGRWHNLMLTSRCMLSDSRPFVKLQSGVSLLAFPKLTGEAIDLRIGLDYWSKRDPVLFAADSTSWSRPVVDLNFAMSVHIRSFRLMYKVDNLLNRRFSYVPGWTAPGLVFRWGFTWLIQR